MQKEREREQELGSLVEVCCAAGGFDAFLLGFGQRLDVAIHGVLLGVRVSPCQSEMVETKVRGGFNESGELTKTIAILGAMVKCLCGQICGNGMETRTDELQ